MDYDNDDTNDTLNITPSFKSRSSKGRSKTTSKQQQESNDISNTPSPSLANVDDNEADSSAVVFKKSSTKNKSRSLLGGASTPSLTASARKTKSQGTSSRSRLALSFDDDDDNNNNNEQHDIAPDDDTNEGDISVSEVRKLNKKKRLGGIGSSSLNKAAEK
jgi:hypothetical protein